MSHGCPTPPQNISVCGEGPLAGHYFGWATPWWADVLALVAGLAIVYRLSTVDRGGT